LRALLFKRVRLPCGLLISMRLGTPKNRLNLVMGLVRPVALLFMVAGPLYGVFHRGALPRPFALLPVARPRLAPLPVPVGPLYGVFHRGALTRPLSHPFALFSRPRLAPLPVPVGELRPPALFPVPVLPLFVGFCCLVPIPGNLSPQRRMASNIRWRLERSLPVVLLLLVRGLTPSLVQSMVMWA
jgi:hypothetical protein